MPPTRSPTWWSVTSGPTAVTTPAKSMPSCGSRPVEAGVPAEGDQDVGEVDAGRADRDLDLSRTRRNPVERDEFQSFPGRRACGSAGACRRARWSTVAVRRSSGRSGLGHKRAMYHCAVAPGGLVLLGAAQQLLGHLLGRRVLVHVDLGGAQLRMLSCRSPAAGHAARPAPG